MKLAAAILSAYLAMTGTNADLPQDKPTIGKETTSITQSISANSVESNASTGRRRAVRHPSPPAYEALVPLADVTTDLRLTNHGSAPASIQTCLDNICKTSTLNAGASATYTDIFTLWNATAGTLMIRSDQPLEARANPLHPVQTKDLLSTPSTVPAYGPGDVLITTSLYGNNTFDLALIEPNGVQSDVKGATAGVGTTTIPLDFSSYKAGKQVEVRPSAPLHAVLKTADGTLVPVLENNDAAGMHYIFGSGRADIKNTNPGSLFNTTINAWKANTARPPATEFFGMTIINYGLASIPDLAAATKASGDAVYTSEGARLTLPEGIMNQQHLLWATGAQTRTNAATAHNGTEDDTLTPQNISINNVGETVRLFNATERDATITGLVTGYNDAGTKTGEVPYAFEFRESKDITLPSGTTRITVSANDGAAGTGNRPYILASSNGNAGVQVAKPVAKVTGEQYVSKYLDTLKTQWFYLSYDEVRDMIHGTERTRSYVKEMSEILSRGPPSSIPAETEDLLYDITNGREDDLELTRAFDPENNDMRPTQPGVRYYLSNGTAGDFKFSNNDQADWYKLKRNYLIERVDKFPEKYGGSTTTGPNLNHNPTWSSQK